METEVGEKSKIIEDLNSKIYQLTTQLNKQDRFYKTLKHSVDSIETLVNYCNLILQTVSDETDDKLQSNRENAHNLMAKSNDETISKIVIDDCDRIENLLVRIEELKFRVGLTTSPKTVDDALPNEILTKIFKNLKYKDLSMVEQVNRRWRSIAKFTWSSITTFSVHDIFNRNDEFYSINDEYEFLRMFKSLIGKLDCSSVNSVRFSLPNEFFHHSIFSTCLELIRENFSNLTSLGLFILAGYQIEDSLDSAQELCNIIKNCPKLEHLKINYTDKSINDEFMKFVFNSCPDLKLIKLCGSRKLLSCSFLFDATKSVDSLSIYSSTEINELALVNYFNKYENSLIKFEFKFNETESRSAFHNLFQELASTQKNLEHLSMTLSKSFRLTNLLHTMTSLTHLDLSYSANSFLRKMPDVAKVLFYCDKLKELILTDCVDIRDEMFTLLQINSPLSYLGMRHLTEITEKGFAAIMNSKLANTLERLDISAMYDLPPNCVSSLIQTLKRLNDLDVSEIDYAVSNEVIEEISATKRGRFRLCCDKNDLSIDKLSFYKSLVRRKVNANVTELLHDNLIIVFSNERRLTSYSHFEEDMYLYTQANILYRDDDF
jgi:hypothetical protein